MKHRNITLYLIIILYVVLSACARNKSNPVGSAIFQRDNVGSEYFIRIEPSAVDTFYQTYVANSTGARLFIGSAGFEQSRIVMHFDLSPRTATVDSVFLQLKPVDVIGTGGVFTARVYEVLIPWNDTTATWDLFHETSKGRELASVDFVSIENEDSASIRFELPTDLVQSWIDSATYISNYGILIEPENASFITELYSGDLYNLASDRPKLTLYISEDTTHTELSYDTPNDAFLATTTQSPSSEFLYVADGSALRSFGNIELDSIPDEATINRALLILYADTLQSFPDHSKSFGIETFGIRSGEWTFPDVPIDSSFSITASLTSDSLVINLTTLIQSWNSGLLENHGFVLAGSNETQNLLKRAFYSMNGPQAMRPRCEIIYSMPPSTRF